ncbi:ABC transporter substrate-binding protein [Dactylosporangium fulvum]|uniref:ABC transporter substrate-binding protein n=1 Tax=Dactylosporangium fulvum TaxID=53359 RepID=A0ABY5VSQ3_9ACTN|nr:ABC transporter substrate-binding protein [Dactylosporangium fulvum]UWP80310.1 ABC transporter substrate-binding protein [Dactylosporangium fulvum]
MSIAAAAGCGSSSSEGGNATATGEPKTGGTVRAALGGDPQTLDMSMAGGLTRITMQHVFESLFALDAQLRPQPMLADSYTVSDDGLTYTIKLRTGVKFHDGSTMTATDVKASFDRWIAVSPNSKNVKGNVKSSEATDDSTFVITLNSVRSTLISDLAWIQGPFVIIPASVATAAGTKPIAPDRIVGTGPYKMESYNPGRNLTLARFDGYQGRTENPSGRAGAKHAYLDKIVYSFVTDSQQRLNGLKTSQYDWVQTVDADQLQSLANDRSFVVEPATDRNLNVVFLNGAEGSVFHSLQARQAVNAAIDKPAIAKAMFGPENLWSPLTGALVSPSVPDVHSEAGLNLWSEHNTEKAKSLLAAGLNRPIKILTTKTYPYMYQWAVAVQGQLSAIGVKADIEVLDYPSMVGKAVDDPKSWDMMTTYTLASFGNVAQVEWFNGSLAPYGAFPTQEYKTGVNELLAKYVVAKDQTTAHQYVDQLQQLFYDTMPALVLGEVSDVNPHSRKLVLGTSYTNIFWNASLRG